MIQALSKKIDKIKITPSSFPSVDKCYETGSSEDCVNAEDFCYFRFAFHFYLHSGLNGYDIRTSNETASTNPPPDYNLYLAKPEILAAIRAQRNYTECSGETYDPFFFNGDT